MSEIFGDVSTGQRGTNRAPTSASEARSETTSLAGGNDVSEAAMNRTVAPRPNSTSTNRRSRGSETAAPAGRRRTAKKFAAPRHDEASEHHDLRENHAAVRGAQEPAHAIDVGQGEPHPREDQDRHRRRTPSPKSASASPPDHPVSARDNATRVR